MLNRARLLFVATSILTVFLLIAGSLWSGAHADDPGGDSLYKYLSMFVEVLGLVDRAYVDEADLEPLLGGALGGATEALDPFSAYIPASDVDRFLASRQEAAFRSGLIVLKERGVLYAVAVESGSPAEAAGFERDDILSAIDGVSTRNMPLWHARAVLSKPVGTEVQIERIRFGETETITLTLAEYERPGVRVETRRGVPVLFIERIGADAVENVAASLGVLGTESPADALPGLERPDTLVIDVRGTAGGDIRAAYDVAGLFTRGELGVLKGRGEAIEVFSSQDEPAWSGTIAILIDRGTQGAAEVLATVLSQQVDAVLVGQPTFGYAGNLALVELSNGGRLQLTDAFYTGPDQAPITDSLEVDLRVRDFSNLLAPDGEDTDVVLERGLEVVLGETEVPEERQAA
ncbi:MAG: S41 family peptidase [Acidobacteriota bacterium]